MQEDSLQEREELQGCANQAIDTSIEIQLTFSAA